MLDSILELSIVRAFNNNMSNSLGRSMVSHLFQLLFSDLDMIPVSNMGGAALTEPATKLVFFYPTYSSSSSSNESSREKKEERNLKMEERDRDARVSKRQSLTSPGTSKHFIPDVLVQLLLISDAVHCDKLLNISVKSGMVTSLHDMSVEV